MGKNPGEHALPNVDERRGWTYMDPVREGGDFRLVLRTALAEAWNAADWLEGSSDEKKPLEDKDDDTGAPSRKKGLGDGLRKLVHIHMHDFSDVEGYDERELRYGSERGGAVLPRLRLKKKKKQGGELRGRALASHPWLGRLFPKVISFDEESDGRKFVFAGWRPDAVHVLSQVLGTSFKFRLEDLSHFATHGDHVLHLLDHLDSGPCIEQDTILYVPSADPSFPFKFVALGQSRNDSYAVFVAALDKIFHQAESVDAFLDRFYSQVKLGFERFGPACATPEFQEVELRLWTLVSFAATRLQILVAQIAKSTDGPQIRSLLKEARALHAALDSAANLPSELMAFYRTHFNIPFAKLFEHSLTGIDEIAKTIDCKVKERPRDIEALTELITRFRRIEPKDPIENLEYLEATLTAAYRKSDPPEREKRTWVRRYNELIFTGTDKFDQRRYRSTKAP